MTAPEADSTEQDGPIVRDKRRIDPMTGEVRVDNTVGPSGRPSDNTVGPSGRPSDNTVGPSGRPSGETPVTSGAADEAAPASGATAELEAQLAERTADLQRVQADFANYRKRVDRDRQAVAEQALASVLIGVLPVLDDIDRAREHGEVEGGFKSVADNLETTLAKLGLARYGEVGEPFDPTVHEALTHALSSDVAVPTCTAIFQPGYRIGDRVLRPARVAVTEPGAPEVSPEQDD
jgi:molecular chaperone GrpE